MKQHLAILLAFLILSISVKDLSIYVAFKINQNYIAQNFCKNIDKPQLECRGSCVLEKELKASKEQKNTFPTFNPDNKQLSVYISIFDVSQKIAPVKEGTHLPIYKGLLSNPSSFSIFHPPRVTDSLV